MNEMKISVIMGTRPEAIKLAPVVLALQKEPDMECRVCVTGQHRHMMDQVLQVFNIVPDVDLNLMQPDQTLAGLTGRAIEALDAYLAEDRPDLVLVQGDTTTTLCSALAAFYQRIPIGHVEAGLRTGNLYSPWPEEGNRVLTSHLATLHFAPTETARQNLLREGILDETIYVTGNTVIDALLIAQEKARAKRPVIRGLPRFLQPGNIDQTNAPPVVLITGHRRESFGRGFENICNAIAELAQKFQGVHFVYPVHLNPNVREPVIRILGNHAESKDPLTRIAREKSATSTAGNIHLIEPLPYLEFVSMMVRAFLILTDSGGVQEEAPSLGKPVLVMRETTERPEAVEAGTVRLVGTEQSRIAAEVSRLLVDRSAYEEMSRAHNPYGDGLSARRIIQRCKACGMRRSDGMS